MKGEGETVSAEFQKLVRSCGDEVAINEPPCILWKADHENCKGCPYELGCGKVVHLMIVSMLPMMHKPQGYDDFAKMNNRIQELMGKVIEAKSVEELGAVPSC